MHSKLISIAFPVLGTTLMVILGGVGLYIWFVIFALWLIIFGERYYYEDEYTKNNDIINFNFILLAVFPLAVFAITPMIFSESQIIEGFDLFSRLSLLNHPSENLTQFILNNDIAQKFEPAKYNEVRLRNSFLIYVGLCIILPLSIFSMTRYSAYLPWMLNFIPPTLLGKAAKIGVILLIFIILFATLHSQHWIEMSAEHSKRASTRGYIGLGCLNGFLGFFVSSTLFYFTYHGDLNEQ